MGNSDDFEINGAYWDPVDFPILSRVEHVCLRPAFFTAGGTASEAVAYLDGYFHGLAEKSPQESAATWIAFTRWLLDRAGTKEHLVPWFREWRKVVPVDDANLIAQLNALYSEFKSQLTTKESQPAP